MSSLWEEHERLQRDLIERLQTGTPTHAALQATFEGTDLRALDEELGDWLGARLRTSR